MTTSAMGAGIVVWESASFQNLGGDCSAANETLRAEPASPTEPGAGDAGGEETGGGSGGSKPPSNEGGVESTLPGRIDTAASFPPDGRVSWREIPE